MSPIIRRGAHSAHRRTAPSSGQCVAAVGSELAEAIETLRWQLKTAAKTDSTIRDVSGDYVPVADDGYASYSAPVGWTRGRRLAQDPAPRPPPTGHCCASPWATTWPTHAYRMEASVGGGQQAAPSRLTGRGAGPLPEELKPPGFLL